MNHIDLSVMAEMEYLSPTYMAEYKAANQNKETKVAIVPTRMVRAQLYINKELRELLDWHSDEELIALVSDKVIVLFRSQDYTSVVEAINKALEELNKIKNKI